ncbi:NACHT domain-containing protein [Mucilaginibacter gracilis]|uniref:NACHT domain-containing protein n=1 Tax=Mucilaginibacter gracilis TaxID=423350 RepID=UPI000EB2C420|nr:hypothetical protein [Mucilaginibacter gracilis]
MNNRTNLSRLAVGLGAILLLLINTFISDGLIKQLCNVIAVITGSYALIAKIWPRAPFIHKLNYELRKYAFFDILLGEVKDESSTTGEPFEKFKSRVLTYTLEQITNRTDLINSPEIFSFDFGVDEKFKEGTKPENKTKDWKSHLNKQFLFITGISGSGKTFELIKRVHFLCQQLMPGLTEHELLRQKKIPLYIELKSLDRKLDHHWIVDYISKSAAVANKSLSQRQITALLTSNEVIYFFDGVDEVLQQYRDDCVKQMIKLSEDTGVHVTCRKKVFKELENMNILSRECFPAEYFLKPLSIEWVKEIILALTDRPNEEKAEMIAFITNKPNLQQHMSRPIFLNLFIGVYHNLSTEEKRMLESADEDATMDVLWTNYEDFIVKKKLPRDSDVLAIRTITVWLAKIMGYRSFFIESIQPFWLSRIEGGEVVEYKAVQRLYFLATRIIASVIIGVALSCIISTPFALLSGSIVGGITIAIFAGLYNGRPTPTRMPPWLSSLLFSLGMILTLILVCGAYQGLTLPRAPEEMATPYFSATECWPGVLLGITLSTIFSYRVIMEKIKKQYILPVELFHFDWPHAFKYGLSWGFTSGVITGSIAIYVRHHYAKTVFIRKWLVPYLQKIVIKFGGVKISDRNIDIAIFIYAFLVTFFVASIIIVLLAGRYNDKIEEDTGKKQKLNYGIKESRRHAVIHAVKVGVLVCVLYYFVMIRMGMGNWFFSFKISFGIAVLAFLWFGGMEVINHRILRINLYFRGIAPLDYSPWVQSQQDMGLIIPTGFQMKFYHTTLAGYYMRYKLADNPRIRLKKKNVKDVFLYCLLLSICLGFFGLPFYMRYGKDTYWKSKYEVHTVIPQVKQETDSTYRFLADQKLTVSTGGHVVVGTFVGYTSPAGTTCGFMGMPIDSAYNVEGFGAYRHAALLYRIKRQGAAWSKYRYAADLRLLKVAKNDELQLLVNDKEWQNNSGHYQLSMTVCDTCK